MSMTVSRDFYGSEPLTDSGLNVAVRKLTGVEGVIDISAPYAD
jgi:hypothetical protein